MVEEAGQPCPGALMFWRGAEGSIDASKLVAFGVAGGERDTDTRVLDGMSSTDVGVQLPLN